MGLYKHIREAWNRPRDSEFWSERLIKWRQEHVTVRVDRPTRLDRARSLGYKAKQGVFVVRQRVIRGGHRRPTIRSGRKSRQFRKRMVLDKSYQSIAEERVAVKFTNCEVLNSYWVGQDGRHYWYEVIMVDRANPSVLADKHLSWVRDQKSRVFRGVTSAGRRSRGLMNTGKGAEHLRPSRSADWRRRSL